MFQSAKQITGFPKNRHRGRGYLGTTVSICQADYWLPQDASSRLCSTGECHVSICQADYWLPQEYGSSYLQCDCKKFQSAKQITGFPKTACKWDSVIPFGFNLPSRLLASPSSRIIRLGTALPMFQSAKQITGFPKFNPPPRGWHVGACFNLPSRLLASPS